MRDTTPDIERRLAKMIASRSPAERLRMASQMFETGKILMKAGLMRKNKSLTDEELKGQMFLRLYGEEFSSSEMRQIVSSIPNMKLDPES